MLSVCDIPNWREIVGEERNSASLVGQAGSGWCWKAEYQVKHIAVLNSLICAAFPHVA